MSVDKTQKKELLQAYKGRRRVGCVYGLRHRPTGRMLVQHDADVQSARNRFRFFASTNTCPHPCLRALFERLGGAKRTQSETLVNLLGAAMC